MQFFIISVPTPIKKKFKPDLDYLKKASVSIAKIIKKRSKACGKLEQDNPSPQY